MKERIKKIRGTRTCGGGSHKKRRGKGSKGGSGNAGAYGHHFVRSLKLGIRKGKRRSPHPYMRTAKRGADGIMNVGELDEKLMELLRAGKAEERGDAVFLDAAQLGIRKILGRGDLTRKVVIRVTAEGNEISRVAREKIERAGGRVEVASAGPGPSPGVT